MLVLLAAGMYAAFRLSPVRAWIPDDTRYAEEIRAAAARHGVDPRLVRSVIWRESRFRAGAVGGQGEIGLMQLLPKGAVAEYFRVHRKPPMSRKELFEVRNNLEIGCWYLGTALRRWKNADHSVERALVQYNAGEGRAREWCLPPAGKGTKDPIPAPVRSYVDGIMTRYHGYCKK